MATPAYSGGPWGIKDGEDQSILNLAAHNLTPEQLATLNSTGQLDVPGANGQTIRYYKNPDQYDNPGADSGLARTLVSSDNGYKAVVNPFGSDAHLGNVFLNYDGQGNYTNPTTYAPSTSMFKDVITNPGVLMMLTAGLGGIAGMGAAAAEGGAAVGAGSAAGAGSIAAWSPEMAAAMEGMGASGVGLSAGEAAAMGAGGAGSAVGSGVFNAAVDSQLASQALGLTAADMAGAVSPAVAYGLPAAEGGLLSSAAESLAPKVVKSFAETAADTAKASGLLGPIATGLGALAGSQGQQANQSSVRDIPEWLKPYANQSLNAAQGLLQQQTAPGAMQGYQSMRDVGQGLLATPQMGNGFNRFFPGR